jgi:hypothetical protein
MKKNIARDLKNSEEQMIINAETGAYTRKTFYGCRVFATVSQSGLACLKEGVTSLEKC